MSALLAKLGVSLLAILALAGIARLLKLGGDLRIRDEDQQEIFEIFLYPDHFMGGI